ncbi:sulfite exporter TauE/SafE family protein [Sneathiella sp.]|uniref:sulfite exporter TauE/SafE family protein n=1 Tax=Sneathiella sp. TaxID=1964365 RepID=UPI002FE0BB6D
MPFFDIVLIMLAAFGAGVLNTIAGGGTFLTFPALVFTGIPPVVANATSAVAVFPGYLGGTFGFRKEIGRFPRRTLLLYTAITLAGGAVGSLLLLISSNEAFSLIVPFLLLGATLIFLYGKELSQFAARYAGSGRALPVITLFVSCIYGGYFNGGLGIVLLAVFALWGMTDLHQMNGLKNGLSFILSTISVAIFAVGGLVLWYQAILMMIAALIGGYAGAPIARALPRPVIRAIIALIGFTMSAIFFWQAF